MLREASEGFFSSSFLLVVIIQLNGNQTWEIQREIGNQSVNISSRLNISEIDRQWWHAAKRAKKWGNIRRQFSFSLMKQSEHQRALSAGGNETRYCFSLKSPVKYLLSSIFDACKCAPHVNKQSLLHCLGQLSLLPPLSPPVLYLCYWTEWVVSLLSIGRPAALHNCSQLPHLPSDLPPKLDHVG